MSRGKARRPRVGRKRACESASTKTEKGRESVRPCPAVRREGKGQGKRGKAKEEVEAFGSEAGGEAVASGTEDGEGRKEGWRRKARRHESTRS